MPHHLNRRRLLLGGAAAAGAVVYLGAASRADAAVPPSPAEVARYAEALLAKVYPADGPGAAVLLAQGDRVLFRSARGLADLEAKTPLKPGDLFRIGSVTKQMSAAGLLKLVEIGKVSLDDPLTKFVPGYPNGDAITVLMLLNHTSGIRSYTGLPGYMGGPLIQRDLTTAQMIEVFRDQPAEFAPGANWNYNNSGYVLVGAVIEAASGMAWHEWLATALFRPLGMTNTGYGGDPAFSGRQVHGYTKKDGQVAPMMVLSMTQPHAAGAIVSTVDDLLKWNRALHEGRVLTDPIYQRMITPVGNAAAPVNYGFGVSAALIRTFPALHHNGGIFGFGSTLFYVPGADITVAVLENTDTGYDVLPRDVFAARLAAFALGDPYPEMVAIPVDAATLKAAEGVYLFEGDVRRILRVVDGRLTAQRDAGRRTPLTPIAADDFLYEDGLNRLKLVREGGAIVGMRFWPNGDGPGVVGVRTSEPLPEAPAPVVVPRAALERLLGTYVNGGLSLRVFFEGDQFMGQIAGQPPVKLRALSPLEFAVDEANARVVFAPGDGPAGELVIRQGGRETGLKRAPG